MIDDNTKRTLEIVAAFFGIILGIFAIPYYFVALYDKRRKVLYGLLALIAVSVFCGGVYGAYHLRAELSVADFKYIILSLLIVSLACCSAVVYLWRKSTGLQQTVRNLKERLGAKGDGSGELSQVKSVLTATQMELAQIKARCKPSVAVFVPRSLTDQDSFWMEFAKFVIVELQKRKFQPILEYLHNDYSSVEQVSCLKSFDWASINGAIVSLVNASVLPELSRIMDNLGKSGPPYVLHDFAPDAARNYFDSLKIEGNLVYVDNEAGGRIAADIMHGYFTKVMKISPPYHILVVPGSNAHPHSEARIVGFQKQMTHHAACHIDRTNDGNWTYDGAVAAMLEYSQRPPSQRASHVHGIFVCNDDMALGVQKVLIDRKRGTLKDAAIVGFDYAYLLRQLWKQNPNDGPIIATVDAMVRMQAIAAVDLIAHSIEARGSKKTTKVSPQLMVRPGLNL